MAVQQYWIALNCAGVSDKVAICIKTQNLR